MSTDNTNKYRIYAIIHFHSASMSTEEDILDSPPALSDEQNPSTSSSTHHQLVSIDESSNQTSIDNLLNAHKSRKRQRTTSKNDITKLIEVVESCRQDSLEKRKEQTNFRNEWLEIQRKNLEVKIRRNEYHHP